LLKSSSNAATCLILRAGSRQAVTGTRGYSPSRESLAANHQERTKISERTKAALAAAKARGVKLGNPHGPKPFTAEMQQQGVAALRQQADARARQLNEIFAEYAGESANATAKALNDRGLPSGRGGKWTARSVINLRARLDD
jgi:DNA invertase Pin-like site-specific DNA recombinase